MLPSINRIKKKKDFEAIFKKSKSFKNDIFILKVAKNTLGLNRFGFIVSLKISKKATIRNKIRRRLAEAFMAKGKNIKPGTDLVLIALPGIKEKDFSAITGAVKDALVGAGLFN